MLLSLKNLFWTCYKAYLWNLVIAALVTLATCVAVRMRWIRATGVICVQGAESDRAVLEVMLRPVGFRLAFLPWAGVPAANFY